MRILRLLIAILCGVQLPDSAWAQGNDAILAEPLDSQASTTIEVVPVDSITGATGTLDPDKGGLPADLWRGSDAATLQSLLDSLQLPADSPATTALIRRLLLSSGELPASDGAQPDFETQRMMTLVRLGLAEDAARLAKTLPQTAQAARAAAAESLILTDPSAACADARSGTSVNDETRRLRIVCDLMDGKLDQAQLALDLMREQTPIPPLFDKLYFFAIGGKGETPALDSAGPVELILLKLAKRPLPKGFGESASLAVKRALLADTAQPAATRRALALTLLQAGLLSAADITDMAGDAFSQTEIERDALRQAARKRDGSCPIPEKPDAGKAFDAALAAAAYSEPADKAALTAFSLALDNQRTGGLSEFRARQIASILPSEAFSNFALCFSGAALAVGDPVLAEGWLNIAEDQEGERAAYALNALWPLEAVARGNLSDPRDITIWQNALPKNTPAQKIARILAILSASGANIPPESWDSLPPEQKVLAHGGLVDPRIERLKAISSSGRIGETGLLGASIIGRTKPSDKSTAELAGIITSLRQAKIVTDARNIALESLASLVLN